MSLLESLRAAFGGRLLTEADELAPFVVDARRRWHGRPLALAQPDTVDDVVRVVRWCAARRVPIVPQGGNTGLVGGSVPDGSGRMLLLSLARLARVRAVDPLNDTLTADAGCLLADVQQAAACAGRLFPLSLASEGSCTLGGNLASNAGGVQVLRYGNARELCLGLEVVTAEGELWDGLRGLRKDNTGYDLRDLFVGSEGTLGVITGATVKLFPQPAAQVTALAAVADPGAALALLSLAQARLASTLTAFELIGERCLRLVAKHFPGAVPPLPFTSAWYVLLESSDPESAEHATGRFEALLARAIDDGVVGDAAIAQSVAQARAFWALRERIPGAQATEGRNVKHDIALPISAIARFVEHTEAALQRAFPGVRTVVFGHLGDGNLHYNVDGPAGVDADAFFVGEPQVNRIVYDAVARFGGSISAEHGIGQLKVDENRRHKSPVELALMARVKQALDPHGIMNPGRVLG